ncbi:MAG: glycosyltransferase family 4 protein [Bacillota bacterium]
MKLKNICIIGPVAPPMGGDAKAIKTLVDSNMYKHIFNTELLNISDGTMRSSGRKSLTWGKIKKILQLRRNLKKLIKKEDITIFYLTIAQSKLGSLRDIIFLKTILDNKSKESKIIIHLHGGGFKNHYLSLSKIYKNIIKKYFLQIDTAIVLSESLVSMFEDIIPLKKIKIVQNCVDNQFLLNEKEFNYKLENITKKDLFNILYLSNMIKSKGYFDVLMAAKLLKENKNIMFCFAGGFPNQADENEFLEFIDEENLTENVKYVGVIDGIEKLELLKASDIFTLPTSFPPEGQPISILEAMNAGMPIITTNQGGIGDIIKTGENGYIIKPNNPNMIASCILQLIEKRDLFKQISINNRNNIMQMHSEEFYVKSMLDVFDAK